MPHPVHVRRFGNGWLGWYGREMKQTARSLIDVALSYCIAAKALDAHEVDDRSFNVIAPAFYLLCGFGLELALKASILHCGGRTNGLSHDLTAALERAEALGFQPKSVRTGIAVANMTDQHANHTFRYTPDVPEISVIEPKFLIEALDEVVTQIATEIAGPRP